MSFGLVVGLIAANVAVLIFTLACVIADRVRLSRATQPVEYYPPRGYSPIDVMQKYYGKKAKTSELFNPLMLYWARHGYIKLEEDCRRGLKLTKLKPPVFRKGRDYAEATELDNYRLEQDMFDTLFKNGDVFYTLTAHAKVRSDFETVAKKAEKTAKDVSMGKDGPAKKLQIAACVAAMLMLLVTTIAVGVSPSGSPILVATVFVFVGLVALKFIFRAISESKFKPFIALFFSVWSGGPFIAIFMVMPLDASIVMGVSVAIAALVMLLFSRLIEFRSKKDVEIYGRIRAFKRFLVQAELDKLETLVEEDPDYFYDILPYCYILRITEKLKAKFDRISMTGPSAYLGELRDTLMF